MADSIFNYDEARKAGMSDDDIIKYLDPNGGYDVQGALKSAHGMDPTQVKAQIARHLSNTPLDSPAAKTNASRNTLGGSYTPKSTTIPERLPPPPVGFKQSALRNMDPTSLLRLGKDAFRTLGGDDEAWERVKSFATGQFYNTKDQLGAAWDSAVNTADPSKPDETKEMIRHGIRAIPLVGNAAVDAIEQGEHGDIPGAVGSVGGLLSSAIVGEGLGAGVSKLGGKVLEKPAEGIRESAVRSYARALAPTTKANKVKADKFIRGTPYDPNKPGVVPVPGALDRGTWALTRKGLHNKLEGAVNSIGEQIDEKQAQIPPGSMSLGRNDIVGNIMDNIHDRFAIDDPMTGASLSASPAASHGIQFGRQLRNYVDQASFINPKTKKWEIDFQTLRKFRQAWDKDLDEKGAFTKDFIVGAEQAAYREGSNALRNQLNAATPDIAALNREFHHAILGRDVLESTMMRTQSQSVPMSQQALRAAGFTGTMAKTGKLTWAVAVGTVMGNLQKLLNSTGYNTLSALAKNNIADVMAAGNPVQANTVILTYLNQLDAERTGRRNTQPLAPTTIEPPPTLPAPPVQNARP